MSYQSQYQSLFAYVGVTFDKLLDCAANLSEADYRQRLPFTPGSLHDNLFHVIFWLNNWRDGFETNYASPSLQKENFGTLDSLRSGMKNELKEWQRFLASLSEADFESERDLGGSKFIVWRLVQHLVLHSMQHYAEAATYLTHKGYSPGAIDFLWFTG